MQSVPVIQPGDTLSLEDLEVELQAGGMDGGARATVLQHLIDHGIFELTFLDYLAYMPLWMGIHSAIITNPLDPRFRTRPVSA